MSPVVLTLPSPLAFEGPIRGGLPTLVGSGDVKEARDKVLIRFDESPKEKKRRLEGFGDGNEKMDS